MNDLLKIGASFLLTLFLLRLRWNVGSVMLLASALVGALYRLAPGEQLSVVLRAAVDPVTVNLVAGLVLIMVLENIIRKRGLLKQMTDSLGRVARDHRVTMALLPGIIGLLPSAGGAAFSAPLVREAVGESAIPPERQAFINYWFRHIWEYILPLYPGIVLAAAVTKLELNDLLRSQLPLPLAVIIVGSLFCFRGVPKRFAGTSPGREDLKKLAVSLLPIIASLVMVVGLKIPLAPTMAVIVTALFVLYRFRFEELKRTLRESVSFSVMLMVLGIMVFKGMLDASGAIERLPGFFRDSGMPAVAVVFTLPFLVGLLTGLTVGFVGSTFPLITVMAGGHPDPAVITFAFASGFSGVMLSPTHLCYLLTVRYFKADLAGTYRLLFLPQFLVLLAGIAILLRR